VRWRDLQRRRRASLARGLLLLELPAPDRYGVLDHRGCTEQGTHGAGRHTRLVQDCQRGLSEHNGAAVLLGLRVADIQHDRVDAGSGLPEGRVDRRYIVVRTDGRDLDALGAAVGAAL